MCQSIPQPTLLDFYRDPNAGYNDVNNDRVPLQVNCAGRERYPYSIVGSSLRQDYYLLYVDEGSFDLDRPLRTVLHAGELVIFAPQIHTGFHTHVEPPTTHYYVHFTGYAAADLLSQCGLSTSTVYRLDNRERVVSKLETLMNTFSVRDEVFDADAASKLLSLLVAVGRMVSSQQSPTPVTKKRRLERTLKYIHKNYTENLTVRQLAQMEYLSESRYRALFSAVMKQSPSEYIINLRMNTACELLENSAVDIRQVSQMVGYTDQRYFTRLFRKRYGCTPTEYRKRL